MDTNVALDPRGYHYWATGIVLDTAKSLSRADFAASVVPDLGHASSAKRSFTC
jgi:hypothetical protein